MKLIESQLIKLDSMELNLSDRIGILEQVNFDLEKSNAKLAESNIELAQSLAQEK